MMKNKKGIKIGLIIIGMLVICQAVLLIMLAVENSDLKKNTIDNEKNKISAEEEKANEEERKRLENLLEEMRLELDEKSMLLTDLESKNKLLDAQCANLLGLDKEEIHSYTEKFPDLYVSYSTKNDEKIVYLTFDDGPSYLTPQFLDVLDEYNVKATFFVTYQTDREDIYKQIVDSGNTIQIHTASHDFEEIYESVDSYLEDFDKIWNYVYETTGVKCDIFRFPGGSSTGYAESVSKAIAREMDRRGFSFFDWNVSVGDGSENATRYSIIEKIKSESAGRNRIVLLAHDSGSKSETLAALPEILDYYIAQGYEFGVLDHRVNAKDFQYLTWN